MTAKAHEVIVPLTGKERAQIERVQMNELTPEYRVTTRLEEVAQGLTKEQAVMESQRCLNCKALTSHGFPTKASGPLELSSSSFNCSNTGAGAYLDPQQESTSSAVRESLRELSKAAPPTCKTPLTFPLSSRYRHRAVTLPPDEAFQRTSSRRLHAI